MIQTSFSLLQRLRQGDDNAAWERLVPPYTPLIRRWRRRHLPQPDDVDELTQQVFQVVVEKLPAFAHAGRAGSFRAWLRGICVNRMSRTGKSLLCRDERNLKVHKVDTGEEVGSFDV